MDIIGETNFDFLGKRKEATIFSIGFILIGVVAVFAVALGKANMGNDFTGGVAVQFRFEKPFEIDKVRDIITGGGFESADLQEITTGNKLLVKVKSFDGEMGEVAEKLKSVVTKGLNDNPYVIDMINEVGPTVGDKLKKDALKAIAMALFCILLYVGLRFEFRFGIAAVGATFHDVLVVLGLVFLLGVEIDLLVVTALLTLSGYSLNDTVVVFDRIRENINRYGADDSVYLLNKSINEVLRRTVVTSGTTLIVLISLIFFGGEVIFNFAITLALGVIVGTYSSIFVASPILLLWKRKFVVAEEIKSGV